MIQHTAEINITPRTRIEYRFTTSISDSDWLTARPDCVGTPKTILKHRQEALKKCGINPQPGACGPCYRESYSVDGVPISMKTIEDYLFGLEYDQWNAKN